MESRSFLHRCYGIVWVVLLGFFFASCGIPMTRGQHWLDTKTAEPEINVSGAWNSPEWGAAEFKQEGRSVTGVLGDYHVNGVVSGSSLYLVMYSGDSVHYTADLKAANKDSFNGLYSKYTIIDEVIKEPGDRGVIRPITLTRVSASQSQ
jgi:hypothetical protein